MLISLERTNAVIVATNLELLCCISLERFRGPRDLFQGLVYYHLLLDETDPYLQCSPSVPSQLHLVPFLRGARYCGLGTSTILILLHYPCPLPLIRQGTIWEIGSCQLAPAFGYLTRLVDLLGRLLTYWVVVPSILPLRRGWYLWSGLVEFNEREY